MILQISEVVSNCAVVNAIHSVFPQALAVYAFGSRINATAHADSDLVFPIIILARMRRF